jgi:peptidoglycan-associated lipoprotein
VPKFHIDSRARETEFEYMNWFATLRAIALGIAILAVGACESTTNNTDAVNTEPATPGSERDFIVNVGDRVFFLTDTSSLTDTAMETLRRQAAWLKQYPSVRIQVEGHADERGTREYNIALSARRGNATKAFLVSQGIDPSRVDTIAYGKERPVATCDAESCWSQNRRAVTLITSGAQS